MIEFKITRQMFQTISHVAKAVNDKFISADDRKSDEVSYTPLSERTKESGIILTV